jgi:NAD(P)-dependent dehydrogenase (short-subunit alcohol dehydrogenase family)
MRLHDKIALITGAARGIGAATARLFAREGARLVLTDLLDEQGEALAAELRADGAQAVYAHHDVASRDDWRRIAALIEEQYGHLDILVNNAGIAGGPQFEEATDADWDRMLDVNVKSMFIGIQTLLPALRVRGASVVNLSSQLGLVGTDTSSPQYQTSKGAVRMLTKHAAIHFAADAIRVNSVHPGPIVTPMTETRRNDADRHPRIISRIPLGRYGEADEVAYGILYLASNESSFSTGTELVIDGGWTAQ